MVQTDYRTNVHHTLKKNPLKLDDLQEFIECYMTGNRHKRKETWSDGSGAVGDLGSSPNGITSSNPIRINNGGRWRKFTYEEIIARDKTSLDITWLKDKSLADLNNLPETSLLGSPFKSVVRKQRDPGLHRRVSF